jgi:hypothetical protein
MLIYKRLHVSAKTRHPQASQRIFQAKHRLYVRVLSHCCYNCVPLIGCFGYVMSNMKC